MTAFRLQQPNRGQRVRQTKNANALQIHVTNCTTKLHSHFHETRKIMGNNFPSWCNRKVQCYRFNEVQALPLVSTRFLRLANSSPKTARSPARRPRDGANHPVRNPAKCLASYPRNVPAMAEQWQQQCRRASVKTTRKTTCLAPDLDARCPRRKLARRLATWPCNSRKTSRKMTRQNPAVMFLTIPF